MINIMAQWLLMAAPRKKEKIIQMKSSSTIDMHDTLL